MGCDVFLSYATPDLDLAESLHDLLDHGLGIPRPSVFRSSEKGTIANGSDFVQRILGEVRTAKHVVCLVTPEYFKGQFCVAEMSIAQSRNVDSRGLLYGLVVSPMTLADATAGVLLGTQLSKADDLAALKTQLATLASPKRADHEWDRKYKDYEKVLQLVSQRYICLERLQRIRLSSAVVLNPAQGNFKNKLYLQFTNPGSSEVDLASCTFEPGPHGIRLQPRDHNVVSWRNLSGGVAQNPETPAKKIPAGGVSETWIGLDAAIGWAEVLERVAGRRIGTFTFQSTNGDKLDYAV